MKSVLVSAAPATIEVGSTSRIGVEVLDERGREVEDPSIVWSTSNPGIATIDNSGMALGLAPGVAAIRATVEGVVGEATLTVEELHVGSVEVEPTGLRLEVGGSYALRARALDTSGAEIPGKTIDWSSERTETATVTQDGLVVAASPGTTRITARVGDVAGTATVEVVEPPVALVTIEPASLDLVVTDRAALVATAFSAGNQPLPGAEFEWGCEDPAVATVDADGWVTALAPGETTIWAAVGEHRGTAAIRVSAIAAASIEIEPVSGPLFVGQSQQLHAVVRASDGTELVDRPVAWDTDDHDIATVSADGLLSGLAAGLVVVSASAEGHGATLNLEVLIRADRIVVTPDAARLLKGEDLDLSAVVLDVNGAPIPGRAPEWRTSDPAIATVDDAGHVATKGPGTARITAELDGTEGAALVIVDELRFSKVSVGAATSCGLATNELVYCWGTWPGATSSGTRSYIPRPLSETLTFVDVSVGGAHVCALTTDGAIWCQGMVSGRGALGDGSSAGSDVLVQVAGGHTFLHVSAGLYHTCGVTVGGAAWCWGFNADGRLGAGTNTQRELLPVPVSGGLALANLDASRAPSTNSASTCGVTVGGEAWCWGDGRAGQLGDGLLHVTNVPVPVATSLRFEEVETASLLYDVDLDGTILAFGHSCGRTAQGQAYCWGANDHGQLGNGTFDSSPMPSPITGQHSFTKISVGGQGAGEVNGGTTCGTTTDGAVYCWGSSQGFCLLGDGCGSPESASPVEALSTETFVDVDVGGLHACALDDEGRVFCWGSNSAGQSGSPAGSGAPTPTLVFGQ